MTFTHANTAVSSYDFNSPQAQQLQQRLMNGNAINGSPASLNAMYQTQSTVPAKRSRPREDSIGGSPQPYQGSLPVSRSQTPHSSYSGFQGPVNGASFQGNPSYQTMQNHPSTSQSPSLQHQPYNAPAPQQPSPFSPAAQNFGNQTSPPHSEGGSRVNTPQNGNNYPQSTPYGMAANHSFASQGAPNMNGVPQPHYGQNSQQDQMLMDMKMRQMNQMAAIRNAHNPQTAPFMPAVQPPNQLSNVQLAQMRAQQAQQGHTRQHQVHQHIMNSMLNFARQRNAPFDAQPAIAGKPQSSVQLFYGVLKMGGSKKITMAQQWPHVAQLLGYPQQLLMSAANEIQNFWQTHLADFELHWAQQQHLQQQQQQRQNAAVDSLRARTHISPGDPNARPNSFSPSRLPPEHGARLMQPPSKQMLSAQTNGRNTHINGYVDSPNADPQIPYNIAQNRPLSGLIEPEDHGPSSHKPARASKSSTLKHDRPKNNYRPQSEKRDKPRWIDLTPMYAPAVFKLDLLPPVNPKDEDRQSEAVEEEQKNSPERHGGQPVTDTEFLDSVESLLKYKLRAPQAEELGPVDIRALTLSLRSGIQGEIRHALDTFVAMSYRTPPHLDHCDDMLEALIECATEQIDLLAGHASEVSDAMLISSYEETVRNCKEELDEIQNVDEFGTLEYELKSAVDKLICITTILRNFSFSEHCHRALLDPMVLKLLVTVIRHLGTRNMMLRSQRNALDFSKDAIIFLSQVARSLDFHTKEEATCILHFLISFAPIPDPFSGEDDRISFSSYQPSLNRYLPHAVDTLAKLLTREMNRNYYRAIFAAETSSASSPPPYELMTRAFGLAVSAIPEDDLTLTTNAISARIPYLAQGLLAAEILIGMIPSVDHVLASSWLCSSDRIASRLLRTLSKLAHGTSDHFSGPQAHLQPPPPEILDPHGHVMVTHRGLALLEKLIEKGKDGAEDGQALPDGISPSVQTVVSTLINERIDPEISRRFCQLQDFGLS